MTKTLGRALPYPSFKQTPKEQQLFSGNLPIVEWLSKFYEYWTIWFERILDDQLFLLLLWIKVSWIAQLGQLYAKKAVFMLPSCQKVFAVGQASRLNKQLHSGWPKLFCWSSIVVCMSRWVESNWWPYGVNALRCFGQEGIFNYQWSTFLPSSLVVNLLLQVLLILKQENEWKYKSTRSAFRICNIHSKTSKMDWNAAAICFHWDLWGVNAAIMQWCALKPSFVSWLYQTFMIIQDKERYVFLCCSDKEL